jgi:hypothetical protein
MTTLAPGTERQASLAGRRGAECTVIAADGPVRIGDAVDVLPARVGV